MSFEDRLRARQETDAAVQRAIASDAARAREVKKAGGREAGEAKLTELYEAIEALRKRRRASEKAVSARRAEPNVTTLGVSGVWEQPHGGWLRRQPDPTLTGWCVSLGGRGSGEGIFRMIVPISGPPRVEYEFDRDLPQPPLTLEQVIQHGHFTYGVMIGDQERVERETDAGAIFEELISVILEHLAALRDDE